MEWSLLDEQLSRFLVPLDLPQRNSAGSIAILPHSGGDRGTLALNLLHMEALLDIRLVGTLLGNSFASWHLSINIIEFDSDLR